MRLRAARRWIWTLPWLLVILLTGLNLLYISRLGANDDAFITYRVARNLAEGFGPVYNPGERVLSITTPGYALLLAALSVFGSDFPVLGLALNGLGILAAGALLIGLSRQPESGQGSHRAGSAPRRVGAGLVWPVDGMELLTKPAPTALLAVTLTLTFDLFDEAVGMETPLYVAALLATFAAYGRALQRPAEADRWLNWTAVAAAGAFLLRPDGALAGLAVGLHWLITRQRVPRKALGLGLLLSLPWILFAWAYYGSPLPNTLAAKVSQGLGVDVARWGPQLIVVAREWARANPVAALLALAGLVVSLGQRRGDRLPLLLWALLFIGAHTWLDVRSYYWYYVPLIPAVALLAGDGAAWLLGLLAGRTSLGSGALPVLSKANVAALLLAAALYPSALAAANLATRPEPRQRDVAYRQTAQALQLLCADGRPVGMAEIGLIGYISNCRVVDFSGLLQPEIASLNANAASKIVWATQRYAPPWILLAGSSAYPHALVAESWFRQRYEPVDIQEERGFQSVIYQKGLGPSQQRDLGQAGWFRSATTVSATLAFPLEASPAITLHAYLPPDSALAVTVNDEPLVEFQGQGAGWQDYPLPPLAAPEARAVLELAGRAGDQPAAVAWIESNAWPAVHYFAPLQDASQRPRPTIQLDPGQSRSVTLAPASDQPVVLEVLHRDRPGVQLAVRVDGRKIGVIGGADGWRWDRLPLPASGRLARKIELLSQGEQFARVAYVALVADAEGPLVDQLDER